MELSERPVWRTRAWIVASAILGIVLLGLSMIGIDSAGAVWKPIAVAAAVVGAVLFLTLLRVRGERTAYEERLTAWAAERAAQRATQEERLRIARELHDLASHGLGLITVRAAAANRAGDEAERASALRDIERAGRQTTTELRRMLAVLRSDDPDPEPLRPAESLADLPGIIEAARGAGLAVTVGRPGQGPDEVSFDDVSPGVQLAVCAIVREALSNTARHAGPTEASVELRRSGSDVVVSIRDRGPVPGWEPHPGTGHGLPGLRERVAAPGGRLDAGRRDDGSYEVSARMPDPLPDRDRR